MCIASFAIKMIDLSKVMLCEVAGQRIRYSLNPHLQQCVEKHQNKKSEINSTITINSLFQEKKIAVLSILEEAQCNQLATS